MIEIDEKNINLENNISEYKKNKEIFNKSCKSTKYHINKIKI
jgi:hypothetical protein